MKHKKILAASVLVFWLCGLATAAQGQKEIVIGGLFDLSGPTSILGKDYAQGAVDAAAYINLTGGINGAPVKLLAEDFAYDESMAVKLYHKLKTTDRVSAILGWGVADTLSLSPRLARDRMVYLSAACDAILADPKKHPYNFFIGSTLSDQTRMAMQYAKQNGGARICFIYPDLPFGRGPIRAGKEYAQELGLKVGPDILVGLRATDPTPELTQMQVFDPDFAWIGGTAPSAAVILKTADRLKLKTRFLINSWGFADRLPAIADNAAEGRAFGFIVVRPYGWDAPETAKIKQIAGDKAHTSLYHQGWASMMVLAEAFRIAGEEGKSDGLGLKSALESLRDFGTGGLTPPLTFTSTDHRPTTTSGLYAVSGGKLSCVAEVTVSRNEKHLGW